MFSQGRQINFLVILLGFLSLSLPVAGAVEISAQFSGDKGKVVTVMQNEWAVISSESPFNYLASNDATSCVMVLWRLADHSALALSHFDIATSTEVSVRVVVDSLRKVSGAKISAIISGESSDLSLRNELQRILKANAVEIEFVAQNRNLAGGLDGSVSSASIYAETFGPIKDRWQAVQADMDQVRPRYVDFMRQYGRPPTRQELLRPLRRVGP